MLSYKKWKTLNESFDCALGISQPQSLGISSNAGPTLDEFLSLLNEKKKMKKKMMLDKPGGMDDEDETGDGEMVEPSSLKDKKVVKNGCDDDDMDDDDDDEEMDDMGDGEIDDNMASRSTSDKLMMMKKKMKGKMKKKMCSGKKKMKKEEIDPEEIAEPDPVVDPWLQSVADMMKGDNSTKNWDGISSKNEDALIPASDPNKDLVDQDSDPQPGEVGWAPQCRVGKL